MEAPNSSSLSVLIRRIQRRKMDNISATDALAELYDVVGGPVYSLAAFILGDGMPAQQVTRDVFLKVWDQPHLSECDPRLLLAQLLQQTRQAAIDCLQTAGYPLSDLARVFDQSIFDENQQTPQDQGWQSLWVCMNQLSEAQRNMLTLSYYWGLTQHDIARKLQTSPEAVNLQLKLAMDQLCGSWLKTLLEHPFDVNEKIGV